MQPALEKPKRRLWRRSEDVPLLQAVGEFPFLYAELYAVLVSRSPRQFNRRGGRLLEKKHLGRLRLHDDSFSVPYVWYARPTEYVKQTAPDGVVMWDKKRNNLQHDHEVSLIHFAIRAFTSVWEQRQTDRLKETVDVPAIDRRTKQPETLTESFYPDARFTAYGTVFYLENQRAAQSSENGVSEQDWKMARYNALLQPSRNAKVIFVVQTKGQLDAFLGRYREKYPYRWCWATDMRSITENPTGKIFKCPKNFETHTYAFSDGVV